MMLGTESRVKRKSGEFVGGELTFFFLLFGLGLVSALFDVEGVGMGTKEWGTLPRVQIPWKLGACVTFGAEDV